MKDMLAHLKSWRLFCRPANFCHPWYSQGHIGTFDEAKEKYSKKNDVTTFAQADELLQNQVDCIKLSAKR